MNPAASPDPAAGPAPRSGARGEALAADWLGARGYRVVARNLRTVHGEIDLLVRRRRTYAAVEVKARADHPAPERLVDAGRLERLGRALQALAPTLRPRPWCLRIDAVAVRWLATGTEIRHFPALRTLPTAPGGPRRWFGLKPRPAACRPRNGPPTPSA